MVKTHPQGTDNVYIIERQDSRPCESLPAPVQYYEAEFSSGLTPLGRRINTTAWHSDHNQGITCAPGQ